MIKGLVCFYESQLMTEKTLNLRGLKCPLPALRTRKALSQSEPGDILIVECTDPLSGIDIPNLLRQTGDKLEETRKDKKLSTFRIRKM
jgi:tRNA 2-thiouridine synthesizing protein A